MKNTILFSGRHITLQERVMKKILSSYGFDQFKYFWVVELEATKPISEDYCFISLKPLLFKEQIDFYKLDDFSIDLDGDESLVCYTIYFEEFEEKAITRKLKVLLKDFNEIDSTVHAKIHCVFKVLEEEEHEFYFDGVLDVDLSPALPIATKKES